MQPSKKGKTIDKVTAKKALAEFDNLFYRVKAFSQGSVIGSQKFIKKCYGKFRDRIKDKRDRKPNNIIENQDLFSLIKVRK